MLDATPTPSQQVRLLMAAAVLDVRETGGEIATASRDRRPYLQAVSKWKGRPVAGNDLLSFPGRDQIRATSVKR